MAIRIKDDDGDKPVLDLTGPDGNGMALCGHVRNFGRQLEWSEAKKKQVTSDMRSGDYDHLVAVFEKHFGEYVTLLK